MIKFTDALTLASTKLRTHKIRTAITVIIPSLLFGLLIATLIIFEGGVHSINEFSKEGYGSRFIIGASAMPFDDNNIFQDKTIIARAKAIYKEDIDAKTAAAKKLDIYYDKSTELQPTIDYSGKSDDIYLSTSAPSALKALKEYNLTQPKNDLNALKTTSEAYNPIAFYTTSTKSVNSGSFLLMKDNKENFAYQNKGFDDKTDYLSIETMLSQGYGFTVMDHELTDPFLLPKDKITSINPDAIPVMITYHAAEQLLNLTTVKNAKPSDQLARINEVQSKAGSISFSACYRNSVSKQQIDEAISMAAEIEKNKNNKEYQKPLVIYQLPADNTCAAAIIKSDTRTSAEKTYATKLSQFNKQFGIIDEPDQQKIEFNVIGLLPNSPDYSQSFNASGLLQTLVGSSSAFGIEVPSNLYNNLPIINRYNTIFSDQSGYNYMSSESYGVEFGTSTDASNFISQKSCNEDSTKCKKDNKLFMLFPSGSNSIALDSVKSSFLNIFSIAMLVIVVIASIIMSGTLGRMVADSRRETAVFRAIGFKRIDIANIYITYILIISALVAIVSITIGSITAYVVNQIFWQDFTIQSLLAFGASDITRQFHFFRIDSIKMLWVLAAIFSSGIISTILPLARNIRRNPIKDMRDE